MSDQDGEVPRVALSIESAARALDVGRDMVLQLCASGRLRSIRAGRRRLISLEELQAFCRRETEAESMERTA